MESNAIIYNLNGEYGGNQCSPNIAATSAPEEYRQLCSIVHNSFPDMSQEDIDAFLLKLRKESCGYVAMINTLFEEFIEKPDEFRRFFGYSMYDSDVSLNYNRVLVDLYCKKDNHNGGRFMFWTWEFYANNEDRVWKKNEKDGKYSWHDHPYGNTEPQLIYRWESYCKEYEIRAKVRVYTTVTPKNFNKYRKKGYIPVLARNYKIVDDNGKEDISKGGHYMTITGVTDDQKKFVVSSWGKRYYLNPKDVKGYLGFQIVTYKYKEHL
jgi:hypothetical protein